MTYRVVMPILAALGLGVLTACSDGGSSPSGDSPAGNLSQNLLQSAGQVQDQSARMSTGNVIESAMGDWLAVHLPTEPTPLEELGFRFGDPEAPVQVLEFSDFGCGYCRQFHIETFGALHDEYIETGKVYWQYVPALLGIFPNAIEAAVVGECVGEQGRFREVMDALFERQSDWKGASGDPMEVLYDIAEGAGADRAALESCVETESPGPRIAAGTAYFANSGSRGTPSFFIVGMARIPGAVPLELFREILDTAYVAAERGQLQPPGSGGM
jgi:protein-disulfide isomerase